jgi:hypothetical protein
MLKRPNKLTRRPADRLAPKTPAEEIKLIRSED